ncbi:MAG: metal-dependent transcriptional regulator [Mycobacteriales bacterium]
MNDLIDTTEMYLRTVYELEEEGVVPLRARIAERLRQSGPTVSQTVARMERDGLLKVEGDRHLELSPLGRSRAIGVMRKHRLAELLLTQLIGLEWEQVHVEACRWEHVMSDEVERKLVSLLHNPTEDPHGNPIPALEEIGGEPAARPPYTLQTLEQVAEAASTPDGIPVVIRRISENLQQEPERMKDLRISGLLPGRIVRVTPGPDGDVHTVADGGAGADADRFAAAHIFVSVI